MINLIMAGMNPETRDKFFPATPPGLESYRMLFIDSEHYEGPKSIILTKPNKTMGNFKIVIEGIGSPEMIKPIIREAVGDIQDLGVSVNVAIYAHNPGTDQKIADNMLDEIERAVDDAKTSPVILEGPSSDLGEGPGIDLGPLANGGTGSLNSPVATTVSESSGDPGDETKDD
jgi:hypothetical protein